MNKLKLYIIGLIMLPVYLSLQACNSNNQSSTLSIEQIREGDLQALKENMKYVKIDGRCYSVVKYHTYGYDIMVHSHIPCD